MSIHDGMSSYVSWAVFRTWTLLNIFVTPVTATMHAAFDKGSWALFPTMELLDQILEYTDSAVPRALNYAQVCTCLGIAAKTYIDLPAPLGIPRIILPVSFRTLYHSGEVQLGWPSNPQAEFDSVSRCRGGICIQ